MTTLGDIFEIPESVHQGDFVLRLTEGLAADKRKATLAQYVVTPQLVACFEQALTLVGSAVTGNSSKGAYLHGSFGSGKSHFMAVLDLILEGDTDARSIAELAGPISKNNRWWEGRRFLIVPFHMIGATSMESAVLGGYARFIRERHPEAPTPGFYRSQSLLENAEQLRERMGDEPFFAALGGTDSDGGWGALAAWDADTYAAAAAAPPEDPEHQRLVGALISSFFTHVRQDAQDQDYIDLDRGLAVLSRHAQSLGYAAVVLFLDELILWLASHSADQNFLNREGQKVAKLVEAGDAGRPIPIISFIARQRDLRELVGDSLPGADKLAFADVLQWWEARFDKIVLEDRNLPAIIERRLLKVRSAAAKQTLHEAFERSTRVRQEVLDILLTREGDKRMFAQVYPFSPALVQTLVALSGLLQRERTALKLMLQLLVKNRDLMTVGDVIPVGDLFDVIMDGDEPFTPVIKRMFDRAREIWQRKLLPLLESDHGVEADAVAAGSVDPVKARRFRADAGLLKTLMLSALAPEVESLRNLTPARLVALNHGTIKSPLPGGEATTALAKVREWASHVGEIHLSQDSNNPLISMQLAGVDVEGIYENARSFDSYGNRVRQVQNLLFSELAVESTQQGLFAIEYGFQWRGSARRAELLFQNVRELGYESYRPSDGVWRVLIDYPFDEGAFTPRDDRAKVQAFRDRGESVQTLVWLPSFLNEKAMGDLGRLVVFNHVLSPNRFDEYAGYLPMAERIEARAILQNQREQLERRVRLTLQQAYGIAQGNNSAIDTTHDLEEHFESVHTGLKLAPPPGGNFKSSLDHLLDQALSHQFPAHPAFESEVRKPAIRKAWTVIEQAVDAADSRVGMERTMRDDVIRIVVPLQLGNCGEAHFHLGEHWRTHFERKMAEHQIANPSVAMLHRWCDEPRPMGLSRDLMDLVVMTFAAQTARSFVLHGAPVTPELGNLHRETELREQSLPAIEQWQLAVGRAAEVFGLSVGTARNANHVAALSSQLQARAREKLDGLRAYIAALDAKTRAWELAASGARSRTADACLTLLDALASGEPALAIGRLAGARLETSAAAMGTTISRADALRQCLKSSEWNVVELIRKRRASDPAAAEIVEAVVAALEADEHVTALASVLSSQHQRALALLDKGITPPPEHVSPPPRPPGDKEVRSVQKRGLGASEALKLIEQVEADLRDDPELRVDIDCRVFRAGS